MDKHKPASVFSVAVWVAALGYFVDIYDLLLFSVIWKPSLTHLGVGADKLVPTGELLINLQMTGLLLGGILWGVMGDKRGRLSVLFGSIITYSLANLLNGFATEVWEYALLRFIAGIGLAGELGAGITLVSETLPKEKRGIGTMLVAGVGVSGAIFAGMMWRILSNGGEDISVWRTCYFIGGGLGLMLLFLRVSVFESGMFAKTAKSGIQRGNFWALFSTRERLLRYVRCVLIGLPTWFTMGILVTFCQSFAELLGVRGTVESGIAIMYAYAGITAGDFASGALSQVLRSRKKALLVFLAITALGFVLYFNAYGVTSAAFYWIIVLLGFGNGFWAILVTNAAEQFGTNLRATAATTVPNFVRGSLPVITIVYKLLQTHFTQMQSASMVAAICIGIAVVSLYYMRETFATDLDFVE